MRTDVPVQISAAHLRLSDADMNDAVGGALSPRGACDAAFDSGYFALLSVLTSDERAAFEHPSDEVVVLASSRLGLDATQGVELVRLRHSSNDWPGLAEVLAWARGPRAKAHELEGE